PRKETPASWQAPGVWVRRVTKKQTSTVNDPKGLQRALAEMQRASEGGDPDAMQRAWGEVWDYLGRYILGEAPSGDDEERVREELVKTGQAHKTRSQKGENHSKKAKKAGVNDLAFQL